MPIKLKRIPCALCGKFFDQRSIANKYCGKTCTAELHRKKAEDYRKIYATEPKEPRQGESTMPDLIRLANEAVANHTSYGKWVAGIK